MKRCTFIATSDDAAEGGGSADGELQRQPMKGPGLRRRARGSAEIEEGANNYPRWGQ